MRMGLGDPPMRNSTRGPEPFTASECTHSLALVRIRGQSAVGQGQAKGIGWQLLPTAHSFGFLRSPTHKLSATVEPQPSGHLFAIPGPIARKRREENEQLRPQLV